ncbi:unnamed protein product [Rotaria sp. Silwood2]|nr:unnamed protein product [Rotaria sp. Silwood2]CAF2714965.1 unnamed protein product [Rotaria sp. Silwood2]
MSSETVENISSLSRQQNEKSNNELWKKLKIEFLLDHPVFPDNVIYGNIKVDPESAQHMIKKFIFSIDEDDILHYIFLQLVVDGSNETDFDSKYRYISARGFDPTQKEISVRIDAEPKDSKLNPKESNTVNFSIVRKIFSFTPTASIKWTDENSKPDLIIQWSHLGNPVVKKYILILDKKEINYIRNPTIADAYKVCLKRFDAGPKSTEHTIQIVAILTTKVSSGEVVH